MPYIKDVPLPYFKRVKGYIDETGEIEVEVLNQLGQWQSEVMDRHAFQAFTNGTNIYYTKEDYEEDLIIDWNGLCNGGEPHYPWECTVCLECNCQPMAHVTEAETEAEYDECFPVLIQDRMPFDWGQKTATGFWATELLKKAHDSMMFEKLSRNLKNNFVDSQTPGKITFRRYGGVKDDTEEKNNSQAKAASWQDTDGTWHRLAQGQEQVFTKGEA